MPPELLCGPSFASIDPATGESYSVSGIANSKPKFSMRSWTSLPRPLLICVAVLFCVATASYALSWMHYSGGPAHPVELGFNQHHDVLFDRATSSIPIYEVRPESPAERAGLRAGDHIIGLNGHTLTSYALFDRIWSRSRPGDSVDVTVRRSGDPQPLTLHAIFRSARTSTPGDALRESAGEILILYPVFFVLVGFVVLFLRLDDAQAWRLALLFACFVTAPSFDRAPALPDLLRAFTSVYRTVFLSLISSAFYIFFALFPERYPLDRRAPWLKRVALAVGASQIPAGLSYSDPRWPAFATKVLGDRAPDHLRHTLTYGFVVLGLVSLLWNCSSRKTSPEAQRKSRVLLWGTLLGLFPGVFEHIIIDFSGYRPPFWIDVVLALLVLLYPLSFAYSIVKHRVLEIPVLLRRSARYVLVQRSYLLLLFCGALLAIFLFARFFSGYFAQNSEIGMALSACFGVALVWVSGPLVKRGTDRIDRAFFRSSYDARMILQDLAEKIRTATDRREQARMLELHIEGALHPRSLACYLEARDGNLTTEPRTVPRDRGTIPPPPPRPKVPFRFGARFVLRDTDTIPASLPFLTELVRHGKAWDVPPPVLDEAGDNPALAPECLVPILGRDGNLIGLMVLGGRLS